MFSISVKDDIRSALKRLDNFDRRQIPFVIAKALTATAKDSQAAIKDAMPRVFENPTPYTLGGTYVKPANKSNLEALVKLKDESFKGTPANKYLGPSIFGGDRNIKRVERLLTGRGILPAGMAVVPGEGAKLDNYGNISRGQFSKILSQLKANTDRYQNETVASRKRKSKTSRGRYFAGAPAGGKLPQGVWERTSFARGSAIKPVLIFVNVPKYRKQFDFFGLVNQTIRNKFERNLVEAMQFAMATSRG
jgi:hypothetical protein